MAKQRWYDIAKEVEKVHRKKMLENPGWTLADTARITGKSIGYISESLRLAREIVNDPSLLTCQDRESALGKVRPGHETFPNNTIVLAKVGNTFEKGIVVGRGTILPRKNVWIVKLDHPFYFERGARRMDLLIVEENSHLKEYKE